MPVAVETAASTQSAADASVPRRWWALGVLCLPVLIISLDNTILNVALPTLISKLHADTRELQWIVDAYVLVFAGLLLTAGSLADRVGRRRTFALGLAIFALGSTCAAFSGSVGDLIAARAGMGIGAALAMPSTLAILTATFTDDRERQMAFGLWAATNGAGIAIGPVIGGLLLAHLWWGSVFLVNVPIVIIGLLGTALLIGESKNPAGAPPDPIGSLLSILGLGLFLWAIIEAPVYGWGSTSVIAVGVMGLLALCVFVAFERRTSHPMLNISFFADRRFSGAVVSVGLAMFGLFGALFVLTQFLQSELGYSAIQAGLRTLPTAAAIVIVAPLSTISVRRLGARITIATGLLAVAAGLWQVSGASATTTYDGILPGLLILGVGAALVLPSAVGSVLSSLPSEHTGVGSAINSTFLQVGGAIGVAVMGSLLSTRYQHRLLDALAPYHLSSGVGQATGSLGGALLLAKDIGGSIGQALARAARVAFTGGMDLGLQVGALVALAAVMVAVFVLPRMERTERGQ